MTLDGDRKWLRARREFMTAPAARPDGDAPEPVAEVTCPRCYRRTDRVHVSEPPVVVFGVVFVAWTYERVAGCPRCVRRRLWRRLLVSVPLANLALPAVAPFILWDLVLSYWDDGPGIPPEYRDWAILPPPPQPSEPAGRRGKRVLAALVVVLVAAVVLFLVLPRLAR